MFYCKKKNFSQPSRSRTTSYLNILYWRIQNICLSSINTTIPDSTFAKRAAHMFHMSRIVLFFEKTVIFKIPCPFLLRGSWYRHTFKP